MEISELRERVADLLREVEETPEGDEVFLEELTDMVDDVLARRAERARAAVSGRQWGVRYPGGRVENYRHRRDLAQDDFARATEAGEVARVVTRVGDAGAWESPVDEAVAAPTWLYLVEFEDDRGHRAERQLHANVRPDDFDQHTDALIAAAWLDHPTATAEWSVTAITLPTGRVARL